MRMKPYTQCNMKFRMRFVPICAGSLLAGALLLALTACGGGGSSSPTPTATPSGTAGASGTPTATGTTTSGGSPQATPFQGTRGPFVGSGTAVNPPGALLIDVRAARQTGFDRVVFEFSNGVPAYRVEYVTPPVLADGSGLPVPVQGNAVLKVTFSNAANHDPNGNPTFASTNLMPNLASVKQIRQAGDFEGVVTWAIGLTQAVDLTVTTLTAPFRVVIDIAQP